MLLEIVGDDMWDPNNWIESPHEHRIYYYDSEEHYVVVDAIDYPFLVQWRWSLHLRKKAERGFIYLRRGVTEFWGPDGEPYESPITGKLVRNRRRRQTTRLLHIEILERAGIEKPTPEHNECDHIDRDTRNCRRSNLRWATRSMQVRNSNVRENTRRGRHARQVNENQPDLHSLAMYEELGALFRESGHGRSR